MTDGSTAPEGWFADVEPGDLHGAAGAIATGGAADPDDWPRLAVEAGFADSESDYYDALREATIRATRRAVDERERADDRQLIHAVRAMDDTERVANELAERVAEWGGSRGIDAGDRGEDGGGTGADGHAHVNYARALADRDPDDPGGRRLVALAGRVDDLAHESERLRAHVERTAPEVAPNLAALAGPVLAARLIALAGGLEDLARMPSGTVQVLGAEDALFAHLAGRAPSPKHGVIYVHEYVSGTDPDHRGSAARALAGKLTIAARVDHYAGDRRPELEAELDERIARIRGRSDGGDGDSGAADGGDGA